MHPIASYFIRGSAAGDVSNRAFRTVPSTVISFGHPTVSYFIHRSVAGDVSRTALGMILSTVILFCTSDRFLDFWRSAPSYVSRTAFCSGSCPQSRWVSAPSESPAQDAEQSKAKTTQTPGSQGAERTRTTEVTQTHR